MAAAVWRRARPLSELLRDEPQRFDALQAARLLEIMGGRVRYRGSLGAAFPVGEIERLEVIAGSKASAELTMSALSLAGAFGPLPRPLAELAAAAARRKDLAARDFLDLFNHRLIDLLIRFRRGSRPAAEPVAPDATRLGAWLFALLGLATPNMARAERLRGLDRGLPFLVGVLARRPLSLHAVERLLGHHYTLPVRVEPLRGGWLRLDPDQTTTLGGAGRNRALGRTAVVGGRVWDQAAGLRITLGPLAPSALRSFLPGAAGWASLRTLLAFALDGAFALELVLLAAAHPANAARLGPDRPRLGWTSWLGRRMPVPVRLRLPAGIPA